MLKRTVFVAFILAGTTAYLSHASRVEAVAARQPLSSFPMRIDGWEGQPAPEFDARVMAVLGVDEFVNRIYRRSAALAELYIGYYQSQRQGDSIHSPLNCLPGAGWQPIDSRRIAIDVPDVRNATPITVNRVLIQKGDDRQAVLYWYQSHGRVVASEYWSKLYLIADAVRLNRTDAALVRVIAPVDRHDGSEQAAEQQAVAFVRAMFPLLDGYLPN
jgi:EpsI family protein